MSRIIIAGFAALGFLGTLTPEPLSAQTTPNRPIPPLSFVNPWANPILRAQEIRRQQKEQEQLQRQLMDLQRLEILKAKNRLQPGVVPEQPPTSSSETPAPSKSSYKTGAPAPKGSGRSFKDFVKDKGVMPKATEEGSEAEKKEPAKPTSAAAKVQSNWGSLIKKK